MYTKFGPDAPKEKHNGTQNTYLDILMYLRNGKWSKRRELFNACPHRAQFPYSPDLAPSNYHLFPWLKKELGGQCFQTPEELILAVE